MSCAIALAFALVAVAPAPAAAPTPAAVSTAITPALAREPMYADIVRRAQVLGLEVKGFEGHAAAGRALPGYAAFKTELGALGALNMQGHLDLKARGTDGDLKCILKGVSEDLPLRLTDFESARTPAAKVEALKELRYLLNDNVEVITSPPGPATPPPSA